MHLCEDKMRVVILTALAVIASTTHGRLIEKKATTTSAPHVESIKLVQGLKNVPNPPARAITVQKIDKPTTIATSTATQRSKRSDSERSPKSSLKVQNTRDNPQSRKLHETPTEPKENVLVKKPIPKFNEVDYDDDFQAKLFKSKTRLSSSNEKEDEDFNLDDYDFDVNHDEFAGKMKPRDPLTKTKFRNPDAEGDTETVKGTKKPSGKIKRGTHEKSKVVIVNDSSEKNKDEEIKDDLYDDKPKPVLKDKTDDNDSSNTSVEPKKLF